MQQSLKLKQDNNSFDVDALKQYRLMDDLNYTYLCILLQRARYSGIKAGQRLSAKYENDHIIYLIQGNAVIKNNGSEFFVDENFKAPLFENNSQSEVVFTEESLVIRIERPLYNIFHKSSKINSVI